MVGPIPLGSLKKMGCKKIFEAMPFFLLFLVCSANLDRLCSKSFSYHFKFYSFMFMHHISTRVVCVNGKSPWSHFKKYLGVKPLGLSLSPYFNWSNGREGDVKEATLLIKKSRGSFRSGVYLAHIISYHGLGGLQ